MDLTDLFPDETSDTEVDQAVVDEAQTRASAEYVLTKMAEHEGIDLSALPTDDVAELLSQIRGVSSSQEPEKTAMYELTREDVEQEMFKIANDEGIDLSQMTVAEYNEAFENVAGLLQSEEYWEAKQAADDGFTVADVAVELAKVAAAEGIDLAYLDRETYHEAFNKVAADMTHPSYFEQQKLASESYEMGQIMARGFWNEYEKLASTNPLAQAAEAQRIAATEGGAKAHQAAQKALYMGGKGPGPGAKDLAQQGAHRASSGAKRFGKAIRKNPVGAGLAAAGLLGAGVIGGRASASSRD